MDVTSKNIPNVYEAQYKINMFGYCGNESETFFYENNTVFDVDVNNAPDGKSWVMLQGGCPDCFVVKDDDDIDLFLLFSKRKNVTAAELKAFECIGGSKPQILNSDHDYENCLSLEEDDIDDSKVFALISGRWKATYKDFFNCLEDIVKENRSAFEWAEQIWNNLKNFWPFQ